MLVAKRQAERLIGVLLLGILALNYPLLSLFEKTRWSFGAPALYLYLFVCWGIFVGLLALVIETTAHRPLGGKTGKPDRPR